MVLLPIFITPGPATVFSLRHNFLQHCRCRDVIFIHFYFFKKNEELCLHISPSCLSWSNQVSLYMPLYRVVSSNSWKSKSSFQYLCCQHVFCHLF
uniref:Uncharacterized protein n=1 Tax=Arundo donax TaxID=35708 RepID=A0A0A9E9D7_ARUDO